MEITILLKRLGDLIIVTPGDTLTLRLKYSVRVKKCALRTGYVRTYGTLRISEFVTFSPVQARSIVAAMPKDGRVEHLREVLPQPLRKCTFLSEALLTFLLDEATAAEFKGERQTDEL